VTATAQAGLFDATPEVAEEVAHTLPPPGAEIIVHEHGFGGREVRGVVLADPDTGEIMTQPAGNGTPMAAVEEADGRTTFVPWLAAERTKGPRNRPLRLSMYRMSRRSSYRMSRRPHRHRLPHPTNRRRSPGQSLTVRPGATRASGHPGRCRTLRGRGSLYRMTARSVYRMTANSRPHKPPARPAVGMTSKTP